MKKYFLDANAHVPTVLSEKSTEKLNYILDYTYNLAGHPLSTSDLGLKTAMAIEEARSKICNLLGIKNTNSLCFTHSCTEANDWACKILKANSASNLYISPFEHPSMQGAFDKYFSYSKKIPINVDGFVLDFNAHDTICVGVQSEIGIITDLEKLKKCTKGLIVSDLAQAIGKIPIALDDSPIDIATFGCHKFGGGSVGCLYLKDPSMWISFDDVGSSYGRDVPGTPNAKDIVISSLALEDAINTITERTENCCEFQILLESGLCLLGFEVICPFGKKISNTTFAKLPSPKSCSFIKYPIDGSLFLKELSNRNIFVGHGSACGSFDEDSNAMLAFDRKEKNTSFIRISQFGEYNEQDATIILDAISSILQKIGN